MKTRDRIFGSDVPFCAWMRSCKLLPSFSTDCGFVATDTDAFIHRYMVSIDSVGSREVQPMMMLEVKTRQGDPSDSQLDTLRKINMFSGSKRLKDGTTVRRFGVAFLKMSGTSPDDSQSMWWGRFKNDAIRWKPINARQLIDLLRFDIHPDSFTRKPLRRHHLTQDVITRQRMPLGFETEVLVTRRS